MTGNLFKGVFGVFAIFTILILAASLFASQQLGGSIGATPFVILGVGAALFFISRNRKNDAAQASAAIASSGAGPNERRAADGTSLVFQGYGATIEVRDDCISIVRYGTASLLTQGIKGEKRIFFGSITAIQLKDSGKTEGGYIQFSIHGGRESIRGIWEATTDENTVMFTKEQSGRFHQLRDLVEKKLAERHAPAIAAAPQSLADELTKLADLRDRGVLTDKEFARQKLATLAR